MQFQASDGTHCFICYSSVSYGRERPHSSGKNSEWPLFEIRSKYDSFPLSFLWQLSLDKERYRNHQTSFRHPNKRNETELSKHIWNLKDRKESFHAKWRILRTCKPYNNESKKCNLCLQEKYFTSFLGKIFRSSLNKRYELASSCRHRNRFTLKFFRIT